jgi:poly(3-hydroxyalkanoate) synthetase
MIWAPISGQGRRRESKQMTKQTGQPVGASSETQVPQRAGPDAWAPFSNPLLWPFLAAASLNQASARFFNDAAAALAGNFRRAPDVSGLTWATPNSVVLELPTMRLRDFSIHPRGQATLICAPYALHGAIVADFAPGHSVVETLHLGGVSRLFVTDWRSATPEMRYFSIDSYLADLNVAVDELGAPVDIVGLCQGGWLALVYAARFPGKVRRLVLVGAPVDVCAGDSQLSRLTDSVPLSAFEELVRRGEGLVVGQSMLELWSPVLDANQADAVLQVPSAIDPVRLRELHERFHEWNAGTVNLPGTYYLQVSRWLFKENQIAEGRFVALGRRIDLARVDTPMFLLAAGDDKLVSADQLFETARLVSTPKAFLEMATEPCGHLSLFLGADVLGGTWRKIAHWLNSDLKPAHPS